MQLHNAQKLEAMGTLAGGMAHDLNNAMVPLLALTKRCHPQSLRQMRWANAMLKVLSPQILGADLDLFWQPRRGQLSAVSNAMLRLRKKNAIEVARYSMPITFVDVWRPDRARDGGGHDCL